MTVMAATGLSFTIPWLLAAVAGVLCAVGDNRDRPR